MDERQHIARLLVSCPDGPIIEQDVARVSHRQSIEELERIGRDIERVVLARAVNWHLEDRVLIHENRTVVF